MNMLTDGDFQVDGYENKGYIYMSNFNCEHCGTACLDSDCGYVTGCEHYQPDIKPMRGFGMQIDIKTGNARKWFIDEFGAKRWADNNQQCDS